MTTSALLLGRRFFGRFPEQLALLHLAQPRLVPLLAWYLELQLHTDTNRNEQTPQEQTLAILLTGFGALALMVALEGFRRGGDGALRGMWVMIALLFSLVVHIARVGRADAAVFYLVLAGVALTGQLLARGLHRSGPDSVNRDSRI